MWSGGGGVPGLPVAGSALGNLLTSSLYPPPWSDLRAETAATWCRLRRRSGGECGAGPAPPRQSPGQYFWGADHGLDGERGHHSSQVPPLLLPLLPWPAPSGAETLIWC